MLFRATWLNAPTVEELAAPETAERWLGWLGCADPARTRRDLRDLLSRGGLVHEWNQVLRHLHELLPSCPDPGMVLRNFDRYLATHPRPSAQLAMFLLDHRSTEVVVRLFGHSQFFSELIIRDPELVTWLRGQPPALDWISWVEQLGELLKAETTEAGWLAVVRRFRRREMLRIVYNDIVLDSPLESITLDLSQLADACVEAVLRLAHRELSAQLGIPRDRETAAEARYVVLALGKLGGQELNYSSDIDLMCLYDAEGMTDGPRPISNREYFARLSARIVRLLSDHTPLGVAYRVDMRLRPEGERGPLAHSLNSALGYYDTSGRTWERQALIKCRPAAGDLELGEQFLEGIRPFVYRRFLTAGEISEIRSMKRRIEQRTQSAGTTDLEVKTGHGGIRDVEFVVQFLQLLNGAVEPSVRQPNTLRALNTLEQVGCLTSLERRTMEETYRFLRRIEHRLQTMFDRQIHQLPRAAEELRNLAIRMGYLPLSPWEDRAGPAQRFLADYRDRTDKNRAILNHLLHDAFRSDTPDASLADPIVDLVLDPAPGPELIQAVLSRYPFRDHARAHTNLMALAKEDIPFLSQLRCRHFLASIAPRLLGAIAQTADPDMTLTNLEKVSASLGAKAVLWELFSLSGPSLRLYVELCANSQLLSEILINNPGMIDDLMDSLVDDRPRHRLEIRSELEGLCEKAEDLGPIVLAFRNSEWVRVGTRDILERDSIFEVTRELSAVAEAILRVVARDAWSQVAQRHQTDADALAQTAGRWAILALGKLGGQELHYHGDLDLVFLRECWGDVTGRRPLNLLDDLAREELHDEFARLVLKGLEGGRGGPSLYVVDLDLRPRGKSGALVSPLPSFLEYYRQEARLWERLALTRSRVVAAVGGFEHLVRRAVRALLCSPIDLAATAQEAREMRKRQESSAEPWNLKRCPGGLSDLEFLLEFLMLKHAKEHPRVLRQNHWRALAEFARADILPSGEVERLTQSYQFLRSIEGRLRIERNQSVIVLPEQEEPLARLARRMHYAHAKPDAIREAFLSDYQRHTQDVRELFLKYVDPGLERPRAEHVDK